MKLIGSVIAIMLGLFLQLTFAEVPLQEGNMPIKITDYYTETKDNFKIIGISFRTTNENLQSAKDIPQFWQKFFQEDIISKIPNKKGMNIFCIYTDYEGDFMTPYTVIIGCEVENFDMIPKGMIGKDIPKAKYAVFKASTPQDVASTWNKIWQTKLDRTYLNDFEIYNSNPQSAIEIYVGIH